jgi:hypothetical protein
MEIVPRLPHGIDSEKVTPGALLKVAPRYGHGHRLAEAVDFNFDRNHLIVRMDGDHTNTNLSISEIRDAELLRPAPNLIDDYLAGGYEDPPAIAELFARCDEQLARARADRHAKRKPRLREAA